VASDLVGIKGTPGRMVAVVEDGEVECGAVVLVNELRSSPPASSLLRRQLEAPLPEGEIVLDLRGGPDRGGRAAALRTALQALRRGDRVVVLADEVLAYGRDELLYHEALRRGALFVRPQEEPVPNGEVGEVVDPIAGRRIVLRPAVAADGPLEEVPRALPGTVSMGPLATLREGVLMVRANPLDDELATEARAAATLALDAARGLPTRRVAEVDRDRCSACLTCVRTCPFGAPRMDEEGRGRIDPELCQACGKCAAACPGRAISLPGSTAEDLEARVTAALEGP
jgi:heterodisulfide reductase subunit A